jgi:hypothetical protein
MRSCDNETLGRMIAPEPLRPLPGVAREIGHAMPKAHAQPSPGDEKPPGGRRIKKQMQTSTHPSVSKPGFVPAAPSSRDFDLWLRRELGRMHGDVLHEPIPEKLLRIIEEGVTARGD